MHITSALNLALPIRTHDVEHPDPEDPKKTIVISEPLLWAYHTPIDSKTFVANYRIIAAANAAIWGKGLKYAATAGARVANLTLLDMAKADADEYETDTTGPAFLAELRRLTAIVHPAATGFESTPVEIALSQKIIDEDDWSEAEASIVFFTLGYAMSKRGVRANFCSFLASVIRGSITSLPLTEFAASLTTSTKAATSAKTHRSSPPS